MEMFYKVSADVTVKKWELKYIITTPVRMSNKYTSPLLTLIGSPVSVNAVLPLFVVKQQLRVM